MGSHEGDTTLRPGAHLPPGATDLRRPFARDPVQDVPTTDGLHGHAAQERHRGEEAVQIYCTARDRGHGHL